MINILLGFENLPGLSTKDFVTLTIIQHYIDFKVSIVQVNNTIVPAFPKIASISRDTTNKSHLLCHKSPIISHSESHYSPAKEAIPPPILHHSPSSCFILLQMFVTTHQD